MNDLFGLTVGLFIGVVFSWLQWRAVVRYERDMEGGRLQRLPGASARVAGLLVALLLVQLLLPAASLWWITGGLLLAMLVPMTLRLKRARR